MSASRVVWAWLRGIILVAVSAIFVLALWAGWFAPMFGWAGTLFADNVPRPSLGVYEEGQIIIDSTIEPSDEPAPSGSATPAPSATA